MRTLSIVMAGIVLHKAGHDGWCGRRGPARGSQPVAKLVPYRAPAPKRRFGALRGIISAGPGFFELLPEDEFAVWERPV